MHRRTLFSLVTLFVLAPAIARAQVNVTPLNPSDPSNDTTRASA